MGDSYIQATKTIHNYFFFKAISLLNEGGILAFITSRGVADSPSNKFVREFIAHNTNIIKVLRLPDSLFLNTAGIEVGSDLITVSYTHLDVYKRQEQYRVKTCVQYLL